ncbi:MAG: FKBP-type peptidyl-prolyl cis-trans isomerase [Betaproteobacteria bacterium]|nr:FKBP-type peptidyl-prolyl cis-trans isomerase [Betaproteobacteria bacterium]
MSNTIQADSLVTLNYRITQSGGATLISTFESTPATLQLGSGELTRGLENCLLGLSAGEYRAFELAENVAFGPRHTALVERIPRAALPANDTELEAGQVLAFTAPDGNRFSGQVLEVEADSIRLDFNHPLAGRAVCFEVEVIGIN